MASENIALFRNIGSVEGARVVGNGNAEEDTAMYT